MGYDLTDDDIDRLWRRMHDWPDAAKPSIRINRAAVRDWFATLPVVVLADVERALGPATDKDVEWFNAINIKGGLNAVVARRRRLLDEPATEAVDVEQVSSLPGIPGQPVATDGDVDIFEAACHDEPVYFCSDMRPFAARILNAVFDSRRENPAAVLAAGTPEPARKGPSEDWLRKAGDAEDAAGGFPPVGGLAVDLGLHKAPTPEPAEPSPSEPACPGDVEATDEDESIYNETFNGEFGRRTRSGDVSNVAARRIARRVALNVVYRRMRARERPAPSGPDPLAEPTDTETKTAYDRFRAQPGGMGSALRHVLVGFVADRRKSAPPHAPEPTPSAADYMVYQPGRIEFRAKGYGLNDPIVATISAGALLAAMRAAGAVEERGDAS